MPARVPVQRALISRNRAELLELSAGLQRHGAVMWTLATLVTAIVLIPTLAMIGLFRFGKLKRVEDLKTQPQAAEWAASQELRTPE